MDTDSSSVRIAVLIDADNTSPKYAEALLEELAKYGTPTIKRAYGDFSSQHLSGWTRELNRRAIRAIHQTAFTTGKNSTDSALIIDAMDLLYAGNVEAFALVSSDSDFTGLALRLRESGKIVYGLGRQRTPQSLQNACDRFIALEVLGEEAAAARAVEPVDEPGDDASRVEPADTVDDAPQLNLVSLLTRAVNATADDEGWSTVSAIGNHLSRTQASFDPRNFGHAKLSSLVAAQPYLESLAEGRQIRVRLKGKPARTAAAKAPAAKAPAKTAAAKAPAAKAPAAKAAARATESQPEESQPEETPSAAVQPAATQPETTPPPATPPAATKPTVTRTSARKTTARKRAASQPATAEPAAETVAAEPTVTTTAPSKPVVTKTTRRSPVKKTPSKKPASSES